MTTGDENETCEEPKQRFFELVVKGSVPLDGVMSPQTRRLVQRLGADGIDMTFAWACTPMDWTCPACGRSKPEIVRLNTKGQLMCRLVEHHDHMKDLVKAEFERQCKTREVIVADEFAGRFAARASQMVSAYDNAIICDDCNAADPAAKGIVGTHRDFSYSPPEIRQFVRPRANVPHEIDAAQAARIWREHEQTFALRLKIIERIAYIAATNTHWYQELPKPHRAESVYRHARYVQSIYGVPGAIYELAGDKRQPPPADVSAWRRVVQKPVRVRPRSEDVQYVAKVAFVRPWNAVDDSWRCPICDRTRIETVRKSNQGNWSFVLADRSFYAPGARHNSERAVVCGDCGWVASHLGKEVWLTAGEPGGGQYAQYVSLSDLASVVVSQVNGRHNINNDVADELLPRLVERIQGKRQSAFNALWAAYDEDREEEPNAFAPGEDE